MQTGEIMGIFKILDIFSTRELALGFYLLIVIVYCLAKPKCRSSVCDLIKCACAKKLSIPFLIMLLYAGLFVCILSLCSFWNWIYIKDIVIWVLFAGVPVCYGAANKTVDEKYFSSIIINNFKFAIIVEFIINTFTFSLITELLLQLGLFLLFALQSIAATKPEFKSAKKVIDGFIVIISIMMLYFTIKQAIATYAEHGVIDYFVAFFTPIVFSVLYTPVAYFMAIYAGYDTLFFRMYSKEVKDKKLRRKHRLLIIRACGLSHKRIQRFLYEYVKRMYVTIPETDFRKLIDDFKRDVVNL